MDVELFSIGTELGNFLVERKDFWTALIDSVRKTYSGALTYCANFDAYEQFPFWSQMDLISIDAYFTINKDKHPQLDDCRENWKSIAVELKTFCGRFEKKILFSEFGYTSTDYCAYRPYGGHNNSTVNLVAQANAYRALFDTFWSEPWFSGGFSWIWGFDNSAPQNYDNPTYSPQNKPAANIISNVYGRYRE